MSSNLPYRLLAHRINMMHTPAPLSDGFIEILKFLYTREEAWLVARMPLGPATARRIAIAQLKKTADVEKTLLDLVDRGLMIDLDFDGVKKFVIPVAVPGIFEFQLMDGKDTPLKRRFAQEMRDLLFSEPDSFYGRYDKIGSSFARVIPVNKGLSSDQKTLQYEDARYIINGAKKFAIQHCYCRQEKKILGDKVCDAPIDICMSLGFAADYAIKHKLGHEVDKTTMLKKLDVAEEHNLVHISDNYMNGAYTFICNCCGCCCGVLGGITHLDRKAPLVLSSVVIELDKEKCNDCGKCSRACQVQALSRINKKTVVNPNRCVGCGNCISVCPEGALSLVPRPDWQQPPEDYGDMVADLMGRRLRARFKLPFKSLPGRKQVARQVNKMIDDISKF